MSKFWEYTDARRQTDIAGALIECQVCGRVGGPCVHLVGDL